MAKPKRRATTGKAPYFALWVDDFDEGCSQAGMTLEQEGFYGRFLRAQWRMQGPLPDNPEQLKRLLNIKDVRLVVRLVDELVALGAKKIARINGLLWNPRMQRDIDKFKKRVKRVEASNPQPNLPFLTLAGGLAGKGNLPRRTVPRTPCAQPPGDNTALLAALARLRG